ncbi:MAG: hypothetical protein ACRD1F_07345 [Terriglobales bacterium]
MPWFALVLYLHLVAVVAAFAYASYIHLGLERLWSADSTTEALAALRLSARGGSRMPWVGLGLLLTGAYLTQAAFTWTTPWIDVSILGLIAVEAIGGVSGKHQRRLAAALHQAGHAPMDAWLMRAARDPLSRAANYMLPLLTLGIMLVMVIKPGALVSILLLVIAGGVGAALGRRSVPLRQRNSASA